MTKWLNRIAYTKGYSDCFREQGLTLALFTGIAIGLTVMFFMLAII